MDTKRPRKNPSLSTVVLGHAGFAALLGGALYSVMLGGAAGGPAFFDALRDPAVAVTLSLTVAALLATGAGISAFILLSVERAHVPAPARPRRRSGNRR